MKSFQHNMASRDVGASHEFLISTTISTLTPLPYSIYTQLFYALEHVPSFLHSSLALLVPLPGHPIAGLLSFQSQSFSENPFVISFPTIPSCSYLLPISSPWSFPSIHLQVVNVLNVFDKLALVWASCPTPHLCCSPQSSDPQTVPVTYVVVLGKWLFIDVKRRNEAVEIVSLNLMSWKPTRLCPG